MKAFFLVVYLWNPSVGSWDEIGRKLYESREACTAVSFEVLTQGNMKAECTPAAYEVFLRQFGQTL